MNDYCAPNVEVADHYTCFEHSELEEIATAYNDYISTKSVCLKKKQCALRQPIKLVGSKEELWNAIYNRLSKICKYEYCWLDLDFVNNIRDVNLREKIRYFTFKPKMTRSMRTWLSTNDINQVMQQYQELDKTFKFVGALPSDFYTQVKVEYGEVLKYKRVGIVFNLDTHDKAGSHWVAFLVDNVQRTAEYFDSTGAPPNVHIKRFIKKLLDSYIEGYTLLVNKTVHQEKNSECGVYAMFYLIQRLFGKDFGSLSENVIKDDQMNVFRKVIFRPQ
jgi:hypothetical protein